MLQHRFLALVCVVLLSACTSMPVAYNTSYLYPTHGSITQQKPAPVIPISVALNEFSFEPIDMSGSISFVFPDGEAFQGRWSREGYINANPNVMAQQHATDIKAAWDAVYGENFYFANVLGSLRHARANLLGSKGTRMQIEFNKANPWPTRGVAMDDKGNIYKLVVPN